MTSSPGNPFRRDLQRIVDAEAFLWGDNVAETYFDQAEKDRDYQWSFVDPFLSRFPVDYGVTLELACGHGRNSVILGDRAKELILVDVNLENIAYCKRRFADKSWKTIQNNGYDLQEIPDNSITFIYCLESAVHFDLEIIIAYIKEFQRVLAPAGFGFVHHSNYTKSPGRDFRDNVTWRNFMSKDVFAHICIRNGLDIVGQQLVDWGSPETFDEPDCFSLFQKNRCELAPDDSAPDRFYEQRREILFRVNDEMAENSSRAYQQQLRLRESLRHARELETELEAMRNSRSWRITAPLRWIAGAMRRQG